jgi:DNA-directed RNA polymerase subunit M/transcription elongation factor TFIIS
MQMLTDALKQTCAESIARFIAYNIESAINRVFPYEKDNKGYTNKSKILVFSMKTNEVRVLLFWNNFFFYICLSQELRNQVVEGIISPDILVNLTAAQLAPKALQESRAEMSKQSTKARRSDIYQLAAAEIQASHGIDPNKGEFQCRKCKGTKTSHYSMQTRSSDEPMTVFVCCLQCGNRWRC